VDAIRAALLAHARGLAVAGPQRTRLLLEKNGDVSIASMALSPASGEVRVVLARQRIDSHDLFRRHKTTVRHEYEAELQRLAESPQIFDAIFCNERGELCGARSNICLTSTAAPHRRIRRAAQWRHAARVVARCSRCRSSARCTRTTWAPMPYISNAVRGLQKVRLLELHGRRPGPPVASAGHRDEQPCLQCGGFAVARRPIMGIVVTPDSVSTAAFSIPALDPPGN
jgi:hypothetical protein